MINITDQLWVAYVQAPFLLSEKAILGIFISRYRNGFSGWPVVGFVPAYSDYPIISPWYPHSTPVMVDLPAVWWSHLPYHFHVMAWDAARTPDTEPSWYAPCQPRHKDTWWLIEKQMGSEPWLTNGVIPGLVNVYILLWKDPPFLLGNSTISMAIFHCYVSSPKGIWICLKIGNTSGKKKNHQIKLGVIPTIIIRQIDMGIYHCDDLFGSNGIYIYISILGYRINITQQNDTGENLKMDYTHTQTSNCSPPGGNDDQPANIGATHGELRMVLNWLARNAVYQTNQPTNWGPVKLFMVIFRTIMDYLLLGLPWFATLKNADFEKSKPVWKKIKWFESTSVPMVISLSPMPHVWTTRL